MARLTTEDAKAVAIIAGGLGAIGIVSYFVYSLANPGPKGGSCTTPGTPCYQALQPYEQQFNACLTQYTQLMNQIIASGQAPTSAQSQVLSELRSCMDDAAKNIAAIAYQYVPDTWSTLIAQLLWEGLIVVLTALGLQALLNYIKGRVSSGALRTQPDNGAGIAALVYEGSVQFGAQNNQISLTQVAAWESALGGFSSDDTGAIGAYYNALAGIGLITSAEATALISIESDALAADTATTIAILSALHMTFYQYNAVPVAPNEPPPEPPPFYPMEADCGCQ